MNKTIIISLAVTFCCACNKFQENDYTDNIYKQDSIAQRINIEIDENAIVKYSEIYSDIEYVRLETNEESLIGNIDKIIPIDSSIIILDRINDHILCFNRKGRFIHLIGNKGPGPQEFDHPDDISYDKYCNEIIVWDNNKKAIHRYRTDGTYVGNIKLSWWISAVHAIDSAKYITYTGKPTGITQDYYFQIIDRVGTILNEYIKNNHSSIYRMLSYHVFTSHEDGVNISLSNSPNVYFYNNNDIICKHTIDFGKYNIPYYVYNTHNKKELRKRLSNKDYANIFCIFETSKHLITRFTLNSIAHSDIYNKETNKHFCSSFFINDMKMLANNAIIECSYGDTIISYLDAGQIAIIKRYSSRLQYYNEITKSMVGHHQVNNITKVFNSIGDKEISSEEVDFIKETNDDDNPILMFGTLK